MGKEPGSGRLLIGLLLAVIIAVTAATLFRASRPRRAPSPDLSPPVAMEPGPEGVASDGSGPEPPSISTGPGFHETLELGLALSRGDEEGARARAASVRRLLRTDPRARERAVADLLDPATPLDLRQALAFVFGTFDGAANDAVLLEVIRRFPGETGLVRCALLALGGTREPEEDDDVFGLGDRPWGARGPGGIGITVRREIADEPLRREVAAFFDRPEAVLREAAASALRHSVAQADVRDSFLLVLGREPVDGVAAVLGETLAARAGRTEDASERRDLVAALLSRAGEEGLDAFRFRMEDDLGTVALGPEERASLAALAGSGTPFAVRSFALTVLVRSADRSGGEAAAEARSLLARLLGEDGDAAARDLSARLLRSLPYEDAAATALARAAGRDAAWNVRFTAVETLASFGARPGVAEALDAASEDPDARVAAKARELRAGL